MISVVVNLHREGRLAVPALRSAARAAAACRSPCEIIAVIDEGDAATRRAVRASGVAAREAPCGFGDLGSARNFGVAQARGEFVAFLDGDDLFGENWLRLARDALASRKEDTIAHPRLNYVFGRDGEPAAWLHPDMERETLDLRLLEAGNFWTSASFARAALYRRFPFPANDFARGLGYEDWAFNLATVRAGIMHIAPEGTIHFIRRKPGGLLSQSAALRLAPNFERPPSPGEAVKSDPTSRGFSGKA